MSGYTSMEPGGGRVHCIVLLKMLHTNSIGRLPNFPRGSMPREHDMWMHTVCSWLTAFCLTYLSKPWKSFRPDSLHPFKQQTNYNFTVLKWEELPIHAGKLNRYGVDKVLNDFIIVRWIETQVSSLSKVRLDWKISKQICLAFPNKKLLDYVRIDKHIVESPQINFLNRWKRITDANLRMGAIVNLHRKYINFSFARCPDFYGAGAVTEHWNDGRVARCGNQVPGPH